MIGSRDLYLNIQFTFLVMDEVLKKIADILGVIVIGAFFSLVRLIYSKPKVVTLLIIFSEMVVGGCIGWLTYTFLISYSSFDYSTISIYCAISGLSAREVVGFLIKFTKREIRDKFDLIK